jgi:hypothetical protein
MMSDDWRQGSMVEQQKHMLESAFLSDCSFLVGQEPDTKVRKMHLNADNLLDNFLFHYKKEHIKFMIEHQILK